MKQSLALLSLVLGGSLALWCQEPNPTQNLNNSNLQTQEQENAANSQNPTNPVFKVQVVSRTITAISYRNRSGWTKLDFQGTALAPKAKGSIDVNSRKGYIQVKASVRSLPPAVGFGSEYLTYVLWAITPDGRPKNLGELLVDKNGNADLDVTTDLQSFGLIVTAEPYYAVTQPSDVVVMENVVRGNTIGKQEEVSAKYELMPRGMYVKKMGSSPTFQMDKKVPLELYEARNAIALSRGEGADKLAPDVFQNAQSLLQQAEEYQRRKAGSKPVIMTAREAAQKAEDARLITIRREREIAMKNAKDAEEQAKQRAEEAAKQRKLAEEQAQLDAERRAQAEAAKAQADAARAQAALEAQKAQEAAEQAERLRAQAEQERNAMKQQLQQQLNTVLETRETARGLIMNMSDVLFDFGKYSLKPEAREKLAKVSGIILSHPGLSLHVEGYTDNVGSDEYNQKLSEQRADAVRTYLIEQGIPDSTVTAQGFGKSNPIAPNDTAQGRQKNRRVQIVVSGAGLGQPGAQPGAPAPGAAPATPPTAAPAATPAPAPQGQLNPPPPPR
ncbi:MAG TPA: OmpA family protein [Bryobacteraceae bacterium]|jgi:outer membrane protein OmpA-like peptidoglycan-associated protein